MKPGQLHPGGQRRVPTPSYGPFPPPHHADCAAKRNDVRREQASGRRSGFRRLTQQSPHPLRTGHGRRPVKPEVQGSESHHFRHPTRRFDGAESRPASYLEHRYCSPPAEGVGHPCARSRTVEQPEQVGQRVGQGRSAPVPMTSRLRSCHHRVFLSIPLFRRPSVLGLALDPKLESTVALGKQSQSAERKCQKQKDRQKPSGDELPHLVRGAPELILDPHLATAWHALPRTEIPSALVPPRKGRLHGPPSSSGAGTPIQALRPSRIAPRLEQEAQRVLLQSIASHTTAFTSSSALRSPRARSVRRSNSPKGNCAARSNPAWARPCAVRIGA